MKQPLIHQDLSIEHQFDADDFDPVYWAGEGSTRKLGGGRGASYRIKVNGEAFVLRRYLRGGWMAKLFHDRYFWQGLEQTRPMREWAALKHAAAEGVSVPRVAAISVSRVGLFYRAAIISRFIGNLGTLADVMQQSAVELTRLRELGGAIRKMHQAGIDHADLNANNILLGEDQKWYLIDFDKAQVRSTDGGAVWQEQNLQRLKRSLEKIDRSLRARGKALNYSSTDWQALLQGYQA
jgi:tRNA A-37 threonylcarbamoyl transferase component Bud32